MQISRRRTELPRELVTVPSDAFTLIPVGGPAPYDVIVGEGAAGDIPRAIGVLRQHL